MNIPETALELIERFDRNRDAYLSGAYNEFQLRKEFLDPLFETLGWDMQNKLGYAEAYKDVIHEDSIKVGGFTKAPDYCFRIGGTRKFFVEAKKPSVNVKDDTSPAFQLRRYAWSAKLPLSILSDFEEFAVYDCRIKPVKTDKASTARILYMTYEQYPEKWNEISSIFARDSILKGSFDRYVETTKGKKGTAEVDAAFLKEIESWRDSLARNLALRNTGLSQRELNYAVQTLIDRIIFLRMCEDRGIEEYGRLMALQNGSNVYGRLFELFQRADERYNSGLFHFREEKGRIEAADQLTPALNVEDKTLKDIIKNLYYPDSPYEFAVLPADILGQVYEQFLGKVIRLTTGHRAVVEDKPEVKKAGGVYYTPTYIVDYIVDRTVGKLLEGKTPKQAAKLRILDPACGSGSFLIGAYQSLMDWHRDWYVEDGTKKHTKEVYQGPGGEWRLTTAERKRILLNNIFGVDIDPQAVEVTKLSLLLKVLEGESDETLSRQMQLFHERALPDLSENIKCGNSLIGPDFYDNQQLILLDDEDRYRINAFDWNVEFADIIKGGGFDVVIGNPPYGAEYTAEDKAYFKKHFTYRKGKPETYIFFLEEGIRVMKAGGLLGMITPNAWLTNYYGVQIRNLVLSESELQDLVDLEPTKVFLKAVVDTVIVILAKRGLGPRGSEMDTNIWVGDKLKNIQFSHLAKQEVWQADEEKLINTQTTIEELQLLEKLNQTAGTLADLVEYSQGVIPYKTKADGFANEHIATEKRGDDWLPLLENASQVRRYELDQPAAYIHYGAWLWCQREPKYFTEPKILFHRLRKKLPRQLVGAIDDTCLVNRHSLSNLILQNGSAGNTLFAVLGLFNSTLANWWFVKRYGLLMEVGGFKVAKLPLPANWDNGTENLSTMAEEMTRLHIKLRRSTTPVEETTTRRQVEALDQQIDEFVYRLYGLAKKEIALIEHGV
jgi:type I restriction-modification system DNA methylase subunit/predicted type IV restriction endonuclease